MSTYEIYTPQGQAGKTVRIIALIVLFFVGLFLFQIFKAFHNPYLYAKQVYSLAIEANKVFPEGKDFYKEAVNNAVMLYKLKLKSGYYKSDLDLFLNLINNALRGDKLSLQTLKYLVLASLSYWLIFIGIVLGIIHKTFLSFIILLVATVSFIFYKSTNFTKLIVLELKARKLARLKDRDILNVIKVLIANPRPASINHHLAKEGGLLEHSLAVAFLAVKKAKDKGISNLKDVYLAGLLHDIGKIKLYTKDDKGRWVSTGAKQEVANQLALAELKEKFGIRKIKDPEIEKIVKSADREITAKELKEELASYLLETDILSILREIIPKTDYIYLKDKELIVVPAKALNPLFMEKLKDIFPDLNFKEDEVDYFTGVHPIAFAHPYLPFLRLKVDGKYADSLDLFDVKVNGKTIKAVYIFDNQKLNLHLRPFEGNIAVIERGS